jgi:acetyltransferase EpsM
MDKAVELRYPLLNPNETEGQLVALNVKEGQQVKKGDVLYTLETTKSTQEIAAEKSGYLVGLQASEGDTVSAGDLFAYLADSLDWKPPKAAKPKPMKKSSGGLPDGLRITDPALALARQHQLDLAALPAGPLVTEKVVRQALAEQSAGKTAEAPAAPLDPQAIIVYGGGGHGKSVIELLRAIGGYRIAGVLDDSLPAGGEILGIPLLGGAEKLAELSMKGIRQAVNAVGGIGNVNARIAVFDKLEAAGFRCPTVVHPTVFVEPSAKLEEGVQVFPFAYIGSESEIGFGCIVNTGAIVSHDCRLGQVVNLAPHATLAGNVQVGEYSLIGMAATLNLNVVTGSRVQVGNSATVKSDILSGGIVRAGAVWPS